jgi:hypothetical protein
MATADRIGGRRGAQGPQGIQGVKGDDGEPGAAGAAGPSWLISGVNALGTSGTRYFFPGGYVNAVASTGVKRARMPFRGRAVRLMLTNSTAGFSSTGDGAYTLAFCTVAADAATPTPLTLALNVAARTGDASGDSGILDEGQEFALQVVITGDVDNSPVDTFVTIVFEPEEA